MGGDIPEDYKIRPRRKICVLWVKRPGEHRQRLFPPHTAYVFEVPPTVADDEQFVMNLHPGCDVPAGSPSRPPVEDWKFVNSRMVGWYTCGTPLRPNEVGLLIRTRWRWKHPEVPISAFFVDWRQFSQG